MDSCLDGCGDVIPVGACRMNLRDGLRQKSMELRGDSLRSRQRQHTSNYEVELDSGPHFQEDQRMEIHLPNMNGQSGQRQRQPTNGMKNSDPHADMPRSTSPLNEHYMPSPRTRRHDVNDSMASPREARSEEPSGISGSAGLLRLSGRQGWTASSWQMGSAKPQTVIPGKQDYVTFSGFSPFDNGTCLFMQGNMCEDQNMDLPSILSIMWIIAYPARMVYCRDSWSDSIPSTISWISGCLTFIFSSWRNICSQVHDKRI